jgi:hypothetical protein
MRVIVLAIFAAAAAMAQTHGYVFVAPGVASGGNNSSALIHLGVGGEYVFRNTVGAGAEVGFIGRSNLDRAGMASINGYYHFKHDRPWAPFVTGGYSNVFELFQSSSLANLGGGLNYWYKDHVGLKFEVRDHFSTGTGSANYLEFRFGFNFK